MRNYIRDKTQGGCYFLTFNLLDRKSSLLLTHIDKFRDAYAKTIQHHQYNPVKHVYVTNPQNWQYSTLHKLIKKGVYPSDWETDENDKSINIRYDV